MGRVHKHASAKLDLIDHFVHLAENARLDTADRFLSCAESSFRELATYPLLGPELAVRNHELKGIRR
jgi:toxin ParE1/3/4